MTADNSISSGFMLEGTGIPHHILLDIFHVRVDMTYFCGKFVHSIVCPCLFLAPWFVSHSCHSQCFSVVCIGLSLLLRVG